LLFRANFGFSYIEILVSLLIITSGFAGYLELIARVKASQYHATEQLYSTLLLGYMTENLKIKKSNCQKLPDCTEFCAISISRGVINQADNLLARFPLPSFYEDMPDFPIGCFDISNQTGNIFMGIYASHKNHQHIVSASCKITAGDFKMVANFVSRQ